MTLAGTNTDKIPVHRTICFIIFPVFVPPDSSANDLFNIVQVFVFLLDPPLYVGRHSSEPNAKACCKRVGAKIVDVQYFFG